MMLACRVQQSLARGSNPHHRLFGTMRPLMTMV
jgi:hypothetical protein